LGAEQVPVKTQILQLEPHDDVISIRDKLGWSQTSRVLLVWPRQAQVPIRRLELVLLQRHSRDLGLRLALVTRDPDVRSYARQLNLPVFTTVRQAQKARWNRLRRRRLASQEAGLSRRLRSTPGTQEPDLRAASPRRARVEQPLSRLQSALRLAFFSLGLLAFLGFGGLLAPSAHLRLAPAMQIQQLALPLQASQTIERVNVSGTLPIRAISVVVEGRISLEPSGKVQVPLRPARGEVRFTNLTDRPIAIPGGTVVSDRGGKIKFTTNRTVQAPAGAGQTVQVAVTALAPGSAGNLEAGKINAIVGPLGVDLAVTNPQPAHGGSDRQSPAPAAIDHSRLRVRLLPTLQANAQAELQAELAPGDLLLTSAPLLARTLLESYDPPDVQPTNQISLDMRQEYQLLVIRYSDLVELAGAALDANLPPGYTPLAETLALEHLSQPKLSPNGVASWRLRASRQLQAQIPMAEAAWLARGLAPDQARASLLAALPLARPPEIVLVPRWWPRLPLLPFRIEVSLPAETDS
jgi:hypothetical protein